MKRKKNTQLMVGTWDELRIHPGSLVRMAVEGKLEDTGERRQRRKVWRVLDPSILRQEGK